MRLFCGSGTAFLPPSPEGEKEKYRPTYPTKEGCYANIVASYFKQLEQQHAAKDYGTGTACPEWHPTFL